MQNQNKPRRILISGILLGLGIGGFFDGIVLHQILQWHHMLTSAGYPANTVENLELNTLADGFFHAMTYFFTCLGIYGLWRSRQISVGDHASRLLFGAILVGWGLFNLVEGFINHHILTIHHVRSGPNEVLWDIGFLAWGALMLIGGLFLIKYVPSATLPD